MSQAVFVASVSRSCARRQVSRGASSQYANRPDVLVLALPRGGVARGLRGGEGAARADGHLSRAQARRPRHEELAMAAPSRARPPCHQRRRCPKALAYPTRAIDRVAAKELIELGRREQRTAATGLSRSCRGGRSSLSTTARTGSTMRAAPGLATRQPREDRRRPLPIARAKPATSCRRGDESSVRGDAGAVSTRVSGTTLRSNHRQRRSRAAGERPARQEIAMASLRS